MGTHLENIENNRSKANKVQLKGSPIRTAGIYISKEDKQL